MIEFISTNIQRFIFGLQFFSRIPLPKAISDWVGHEGDLARSSVYFPVIGLLIGLLPAFTYLFLGHFVPETVAAGLAILFAVMLSGGLHEDGLADCADGLGGGTSKERALEIMKDSRIGSYGAIALVLSIGLKWAAISSMDIGSGAAAILIAHSASRASMTTAICFSKYAREDGLGSSVSTGISLLHYYVGLVVVFVISAYTGAMAGVVAAFIGIAIGAIFLLYISRRLGGYTGDGLGAMQQISEIAILIILAGFWT